MKGVLSVFLALFGALLIYYKGKAPVLFFSTLDFFKNPVSSWRKKGKKGLFLLEALSFILILIAFFNPKISFPYKEIREESNEKGRGLFFLLDKSSSMREKIQWYEEGGSQTTLSKMDVVKKILEKIIQERPEDYIGLATFARSAEILVPLTQDHESLFDALKSIKVIDVPEEDGSNIPYGIFKTLYFMEGDNFDQKGLIYITDGIIQVPEEDLNNPLRSIDLEEVGKLAVLENVKLFGIQVENTFSKGEFLAFKRVMEKVSQSTQGSLYTLNSLKELAPALEQLDILKKEPTATHFSYIVFSLRPLFSFFGALFLSLSFFLRRTIFLTFP